MRDIATFYVLGWSFSGPLALMLAEKEPQRTRGVILSASFIRPPLLFLPWVRFAIGTPLVIIIRLARRTPGLVPGRNGTNVTRQPCGSAYPHEC